ncbi:MAG: hypothetical protein LBD29_08105 [Treponema sp.]|jgi:two-component system chemotaxis sensor kinase CheA|nr:hypothetical protein [Treponema sp.]
MNPNRKKRYSFAAVFTFICLAVIVVITASLSVMFFINFRAVSYEQTESTLRESVAHLRDRVSAKLSEWMDLVRHTAIGAAPFMAENPIATESLRSLFKRIINAQSDIAFLYCSNNIAWNQPGGYMFFYPDYTPPEDYDNTRRAWFRQAKQHPRRVVYAEPYIDVITGKLITAAATNIYDGLGRDLGVVSGNISIAFLEDMLLDMSSLPKQETYFLNKQGFFITHPDNTAVLTKNFFVELKLERYQEEVLSQPSFFKMDKNIFIYSVTIPAIDWILVSTVPASVIFTKINTFLFNMIGVNLVLIVIAVIMSIILTRILQNERDENTAMKDNLKVGFFLMDKNYSIHGQYSKALESLFSIIDLRGKNFIALLSSSLTKKEIDTLKDYFDMVLNRSFDQELLDDINPIQELSYMSVETGEEKTLSCGFTAVNRGRKEVFILGNILDITTEKQLKDQLAEEEAKRQEDMHFLFEVIQGDPTILHDFIEDMDYSFEQIDSIFTDPAMPPKDAVVNIYQSIHAIKSNAVILGLKTFGDKLHALESDIKTIQEQESVFKDDILHLNEDVQEVKKNRRKLVNALQKIQSFKTEEKQSQGEYVLIESLTRACNKVGEDLNKKAEFVVDRIDPQTIAKGPRRAMKEVLMQLIRNAVYHGIETPEERTPQGKAETGTISLSITLEKGQIHIQLRDDGRGIDFAKIQTKAAQLNLLPKQEASDPEALLQVIFAPGFSTAEEEGMHAGRGIGLNLVQDRIQELGGTIKVHSELHKGTTFTIDIPLNE